MERYIYSAILTSLPSLPVFPPLPYLTPLKDTNFFMSDSVSHYFFCFALCVVIHFPKDPPDRFQHVTESLSKLDPFPLKGYQLAWAIDRFSARGCWVFDDVQECCEFFHELILEFDQRWLLRKKIVP